MKKRDNTPEKKQTYDTPRILASYDKEDLEDVVGVGNEVQGESPYDSGGGCGCGGGSILINN